MRLNRYKLYSYTLSGLCRQYTMQNSNQSFSRKDNKIILVLQEKIKKI